MHCCRTVQENILSSLSFHMWTLGYGFIWLFHAREVRAGGRTVAGGGWWRVRRRGFAFIFASTSQILAWL